mgnify:CR=1 FL=1
MEKYIKEAYEYFLQRTMSQPNLDVSKIKIDKRYIDYFIKHAPENATREWVFDFMLFQFSRYYKTKIYTKNDGFIPLEHPNHALENVPQAEMSLLDSWGHLIWIGKLSNERDQKLLSFLKLHRLDETFSWLDHYGSLISNLEEWDPDMELLKD